MAQRVCIIGGGVIGLATAYALVRDGFEVTVIEARPTLGSQTSFANGGQLSYRYVAPLADAGVPWQAMGWMLRGDSPLKLRPRMDPAQWRWLASFIAACRGSVNQRNGAHLLRLALLSQATLQQWREEDQLGDFAWQRNGKLLAFRERGNFEKARKKVIHSSFQQALTAGECASLEPGLQGSAFVGGIYTPSEEVGDCHAFCQQLAARLQASGRGCRSRRPRATTAPRGFRIITTCRARRAAAHGDAPMSDNIATRSPQAPADIGFVNNTTEPVYKMLSVANAVPGSSRPRKPAPGSGNPLPILKPAPCLMPDGRNCSASSGKRPVTA